MVVKRFPSGGAQLVAQSLDDVEMRAHITWLVQQGTRPASEPHSVPVGVQNQASLT